MKSQKFPHFSKKCGVAPPVCLWILGTQTSSGTGTSKTSSSSRTSWEYTTPSPLKEQPQTNQLGTDFTPKPAASLAGFTQLWWEESSLSKKNIGMGTEHKDMEMWLCVGQSSVCPLSLKMEAFVLPLNKKKKEKKDNFLLYPC